jgi:hypothetical protein
VSSLTYSLLVHSLEDGKKKVRREWLRLKWSFLKALSVTDIVL